MIESLSHSVRKDFLECDDAMEHHLGDAVPTIPLMVGWVAQQNAFALVKVAQRAVIAKQALCDV